MLLGNTGKALEKGGVISEGATLDWVSGRGCPGREGTVGRPDAGSDGVFSCPLQGEGDKQ
jgi:hypothetical protein